MRIIEAIWEQRNLGVATAEIEIVPNDTYTDFLTVQEQIVVDHEYIVVKCPTNKPDFLWGLANSGYAFIEMQMHLSLAQSDFLIPQQAKYLDRQIKITRITELTYLQRIRLELNKGMFETDRIALDYTFGKNKAASRYWYWIEDILSQGGLLHELTVGSRAIGCFVTQPKDNRTAFAALGGVYTEFRGKGLGYLLISKHLETIFSLGFDKCVTTVSSNNIDVMQISLAFGYKISNLRYAYVKHISGQ